MREHSQDSLLEPCFFMLQAVRGAHRRMLGETQRGEPFRVSLSLSGQVEKAASPESCSYFTAALCWSFLSSMLATMVVKLCGIAREEDSVPS